MTELAMNDIGVHEQTMDEIDEVSGGVLCLLVLALAGGYAVGTAIYNAW